MRSDERSDVLRCFTKATCRSPCIEEIVKYIKILSYILPSYHTSIFAQTELNTNLAADHFQAHQPVWVGFSLAWHVSSAVSPTWNFQSCPQLMASDVFACVRQRSWNDGLRMMLKSFVENWDWCQSIVSWCIMLYQLKYVKLLFWTLMNLVL